MHDTTLEAPPAAVAPRRRRRWLRIVLVGLVLFLLAASVVVWRITRPPAPVSVSDVLDRFRSAAPNPGSSRNVGPAVGVYVYGTVGWERVSAGGITHRYPVRTTLTVTDTACGLRLRWDALAGRWATWDVCRVGSGWRLVHYVDAHKFLYLQDVHDYTCSGFPEVVCRTSSGVLTSVVRPLGPRLVRIDQRATGKSVSVGTIEAWLLPSGLPSRVVIRDHGSQRVLGQQVDYDESATFVLTSATPRR